MIQQHLPKYARLAQELRQQIASGELRAGEALPSFAQMRERGGVSQDTLTKAHDLLEREGLILRERGKGVFVAADAARPPRLLAALGPAETRHPYWAELIGGAHDAAGERGASLLLLGPGQVPAARCEGLITLGFAAGESVLKLGLPRVSVLSGQDGPHALHMDDYASLGLLMDHLLQLGHRRVAYLCAGSGQERTRAWADSLRGAGVEPDLSWLRVLPQGHFDKRIGFGGYGYAAMRTWLRDGFLDLGCTALLAHNDDTALGVWRALKEAGISVPGDLSLAGFDGLNWVSTLEPKLTSLEVPLRQLGRMGVEYLLDWLDGNNPPLPQPLVGSLLAGGTTVPPRAEA